MSVQLLGIDLAPDEVRLARGERRFGRIRLTALARIPLGGEELATVLAHVATRGHAHVRTALPAASVVHRVLALPFRDRRRLARTVPLELAGQLAADVDDAVVAFEPLFDDPPGTTVLAVAARRADIGACSATLAAAGLAPAHVDLAPLPAWNLVAARVGDAALVVADSVRSTVSVRRAGRVAALRALGTTPAGATAFAAEVRWTLAALGEVPPVIVLAGADAGPAVGAALSGAIGIPVLPIDRVATVPGEHLDACAIAAGLVLGAAGGGPGIRLGGSETPAGSWRTAAALAAAAVVLAAVDLGVWHARLVRRDAVLRDAIRTAAAAVLPDAALAAPRAELEAAVASLERGGAHGDGGGALALLRETSIRVPASIQLDLDELVVEPGALRLGGRAATFDAVEAVRRALAASPLFASVAAEEARATVDGRGVEFRLRAERRTVPGTSS
jgi:hypothetical protein